MKLLEQMLHETSNEAMLHLQKKVQFTHCILRPFYRHMKRALTIMDEHIIYAYMLPFCTEHSEGRDTALP